MDRESLGLIQLNLDAHDALDFIWFGAITDWEGWFLWQVILHVGTT